MYWSHWSSNLENPLLIRVRCIVVGWCTENKYISYLKIIKYDKYESLQSNVDLNKTRYKIQYSNMEHKLTVPTLQFQM